MPLPIVRSFSFESMESRCLLSAGGGAVGESIAAEAENAVRVSFDAQTSRSFVDAINNADPHDLYTFKLKHASSFDIRLRGLKENADVELLNENGRRIMAATHLGVHDERMTTVLQRGTYHVRVFQGEQGKNGVKTPYNLRLTADLNWGKIENDQGQRADVGLRFITRDTRPIRGDRDTYVLIHDWNENPGSLSRLGNAINLHRTADQVLVLDWSDAADADTQAEAKRWIDEVGGFLTAQLNRYGLTTDQVTLVGHGLGAYVATETADRFDRGVSALVALDPSKGVSDANFRTRTKTSIALVASTLASEVHAKTADSTFRVILDGAVDEQQMHDEVVDLYATMLRRNALGNSDRISRLFDLTELRVNGYRPWDRNAFDGYEGEITGRQLSPHWGADTFVFDKKGTQTMVLA